MTGLPWAPLLLLINLSVGQKEHEYLGGWTIRWAGGLMHKFGWIWGSTVASAVTSTC